VWIGFRLAAGLASGVRGSHPGAQNGIGAGAVFLPRLFDCIRMTLCFIA
jgi:hypothetical protein